MAVDDVTGTGWRAPYAWLLRRCAVTVHGYPRFGMELTLRTFCSATGPRWAQRTTTAAGPAGPLMQSVAIWAAAEEVLTGLDWLPALAELEYHRPMLPGCEPRLLLRAHDREVFAWLMDGDDRLATARLYSPEVPPR